MKTNSRTIVITAALAAVGTAIVTTWVPGLVESIIDWIQEKPILVVEVQSENGPMQDVDISIARVVPPEHLGSGKTDSDGIATLKIEKLELILIKGRLPDSQSEFRYAGIHKVLQFPFHLRLESSQFSATHNAPPWDAKITPPLAELAIFRTGIFSGRPSQDAILYSLGAFEFDDFSESSVEEARTMLEFLGARSVFSRDGNSLSGLFGQGEQTEITIWPNSYDVAGQYGIRYGDPDGKYWGSNDTLVHVSKEVVD